MDIRPETDLDPRDPALRLTSLLDTLTPMTERDDSGVYVVRGEIEGTPVIAYCTDAARMGGALGSAGCAHIVAAIETAVAEGVPVIGVWHSGGARLAEGVESLDGMGRMFAAMVAASGKVPQLSVVLGPAAGGAAYGPALTDLVVMAPEGRVFVTGPEVVRSVTGQQVEMVDLGGPTAHGRKSGVVHVVATDEADAFRRTRRLTTLLADQGVIDPAAARTGQDLRGLLPQAKQRAYDVKPLIRAVVDTDAQLVPQFEEIQRDWAPNVVVGLARLGGRTVGVIANNPIRKGGCLDSLSAEKTARFVRLCDSFGVPLVVLVDVPGYLPGVDQEWNGVVRRGAKLLYAFAEATVPRVTLITRKAYGGAYIAMNSRSLGATAVYAWDSADCAVMGAKAAVRVLRRRELAAAPLAERAELLERFTAEHERTAGGVERALDLGGIDAVIDPAETGARIANAIADAPAGRGRHGNIPL
ncbi:acyl-CoA carboxylase subunit beta [Actinokineospora sp. 24-640]